MGFLILLFLLVSPLRAYDLKTIDGQIFVNKYNCQNQVIWTDEDKEFFISSSSGTISEADCTEEVLPDYDKEIIDDLNSKKENMSRTEVLGEIENRKTPEYLIQKTLGLSKEIEVLNALNISTEAVQAEYEKFSQRYLDAIHAGGQ